MKFPISKAQVLTANLYHAERTRLQGEARKLQEALTILASAEEQLIKAIAPDVDFERQTLKIDLQTMSAECVDKPEKSNG